MERLQEGPTELSRTERVTKVVRLFRGGDVRKAANLLRAGSAGMKGTAPWSSDNREKLERLHPRAAGPPPDPDEDDTLPDIDWLLHDGLDEAAIEATVLKLRGAPGPSGMGTDSVRVLCSHRGKAARRLRCALAKFARKLMTLRP